MSALPRPGAPGLDTLPEHVFDDIVALAALVCGAPMALLTLRAGGRAWIKSRLGMDWLEPDGDDEFHRLTLADPWMLLVADARKDLRFAGHAAVRGAPGVVFYAGVALRAPNGEAIGCLGVSAREPRGLDRAQQEGLRALARQAVAQLDLKRTVAELEHTGIEREQAEMALKESDRRFHMFMNHSPAIAYIKDESGRFLYVNEPCARHFGVPAAQWLGRTDADLFGAEAAEPLRQHDLAVLAGHPPVMLEESLVTPEGKTQHWLSHKFLMRTADGRKQLAGLSLDITERKIAEREREQLLAEMQEALAEVKTLSGLLPVCASCKSIRDDDGYWQKMESYFKQHSAVEFTHGLCPGCVEKLYPDFARSRPGLET